MSQNAAQVKFKTDNQTQVVKTPVTGITFVLGQSEKGAFAKPNSVINSWPQFLEEYGGLLSASVAPLLVKRMLEKGAPIRFSRIGHYTDITDADTLTAILAAADDEIVDGADELFELIPKNPGAWANGLEVSISLASNGGANYFDLLITHSSDSSVNELYQNIIITGTPDAGNSDYLSDVVNFSKYFDVVYKDLSGFGGPLVADPVGINYTGGSDLGAVNEVATIQVTVAATGAGDATVDLNNVTIPLAVTITTIAANAAEIAAVIDALPGYGATSDGVDTVTVTAVAVGDLVDIANFGIGTATDIAATLVTVTQGANPAVIVDPDYIGDSAALNGFHAFDDYDDAMQIIVSDSIADAVHKGGSDYAKARKDIFYFMHLSNLIKDKTSIIAKRDALLIDTKFTAIYSGGLTVLNPTNNQNIDIEAITDICALAANSDKEFGEWYSFAGPNRGVIDNALAVINNFGSPAKAVDLDNLANRQINMIINRNNGIKLWGNFTAQLKQDQESQLSIARLVVFLQKSLKPVLENYLEEPNDIPTWKRIFYNVKPFLDSMVTSRALFAYEWQGDQDVANLDSLITNNATDVGQGKYLIKFLIKPIASIQEITVIITLTPTAVDFDTLT